MSIQRAYMNCKRCYALVQIRRGEDPESNFFSNDQLYTARNEAMKALEGMPWGVMPRKEIIGALNACANCDYSTSSIADLVKDDVEKKSKKE